MTQFKYTCFISYRNGFKVDDHLNNFTHQFAEIIGSRVEAYLPDSNVRDEKQHNVFLDRHIFPNLDFNVETLSRGLCDSIAWVVLFSRNYFSGSHWCTCEMEGMNRLEQIRLQHLNQLQNPDIGFVVPVLIAGDPDDLPGFLSKRKNHLIDLRRLYLRKNFGDTEEFADLLTDLLDRIGRVQQVVLNKKADVCGGCEDFKLVDVSTPEGLETIKAFVETIKTPPKPIS